MVGRKSGFPQALGSDLSEALMTVSSTAVLPEVSSKSRIRKETAQGRIGNRPKGIKIGPRKVWEGGHHTPRSTEDKAPLQIKEQRASRRSKSHT